MTGVTWARLTGVSYLGLALTGLLGFLTVRPMLYVDGDPAATVSNLVERTGLAHVDLALELGVVVTQAVTAALFYRLFREFAPDAAWALAAFGLANAVVVLGSVVALSTAVTVAGTASLAPGGDVGATVQLAHHVSATLWQVGAVFFGLWLIPMGWVAVVSGRLPKMLGRLLIVGGAGYVLSAFLDLGLADAPAVLVGALAVPASIGEFWIIGYLLVAGIRPRRSEVSA
ncbi:DUF4386 domain-containing protein [Cryptosporangium sp. NPDC051539]|uniref:DUF4386 domain-containing protein n=1 Tax=Cryptosporangium sp. NPDC051539 TaxID=3363962 RepID=UPI0037967107